MDLFFFLNLVLLFLLEIDFVILTITLHNRIFISDRDSFRIKYKVPYPINYVSVLSFVVTWRCFYELKNRISIKNPFLSVYLPIE